jgi:hypothetical protein
MALPYFLVQREMGLRRTLEASQEWAAPPATFLASPTHVHAYLLSLFSASHVNQEARAFLFPGYLPLILAALALWRRPLPAGGAADLPDSRTWKRIAALLDTLVLTSLAVAVAFAVRGPLRWRVRETVVLSVRQPLRVWIALATFMALRWWLGWRVPFAPLDRVRRWRTAWRRWADSHRRDPRLYYALLTLLGLWLALGPPLGLWPAVYWLPGFSFIRVPSRFTLMSVLGLAVLAGMGFDRLAAGRLEPRARALAAAAGAILLSEFAVAPLGTTVHRVEIPTIDRWLDGRPKPFAIAEVPLPPYGAGGAWERRQTEYMIHSTAHWQKTVHGYSGFRPPLHEELFAQLRLFPDRQSLESLGRLGVDYVVVHADKYSKEEWPVVERRLMEFGDRLRLEHEEGAGRVYRLTPFNASSNRRAR